MRREVSARQVNIAGDAATLLAVQNGDLHVHQRIGTHFIDELSFGAVAVPSGEQPSRLLNAGNRVVRFIGREQELAELTGWRESGAAMAVRLVHGGAGQGKTRLAHRFAELAHAAGWITVRARHSRDAVVQPVAVAAGNALVEVKPLLVLVDYAERWPLSDLLALLLDRRLHAGRALRVLLLARPLGAWWDALTYRLSEALGVRADSTELAAFDTARIGPREVFEVARACFATALGIAEPGHPAPELEGSFLTVHMAALAQVLAVRHGETPPTDPAQLSAYLLSRERSHWQSMYDNDRRVESTPQVLGRAVYVAALTRSLDYASAVPVLKAVTVADGAEDASRVLGDHAMCYPPHDPGTVLEPLYPDRLAEDFIALQTPGHAIGEFRPDPWAGGALAALLAHDARSAGTALPLLIESARRWPHLAANQLLPVLRERPELAVRAGAAALSAIASAPTMPLDVLVAIESAFPAEPPADLHAGVAAITERLATELAGHTDDPGRAAALALKLGWRLLDSGRVKDGIALLTEAAAIARRLAAGDQAAHVAQLELALRSLGRAHARAKDWAPAAEALGEAVGLWADNGGRCTPPSEDVASCLADLSLALWHQGRGASSLSTRHRAIAQLRRLVAVDGRHRTTLIRVLVQQADQLRRGDRNEDALDALDEALELLKAVAGSAGSGLELDFAATLLGRAKTLQSLDRLEEAEFAASGAVTVFRRLAEVNVRYDHDLAQARQVQADVLAGRSRWREALDAQAETVAIHRRLARISAEWHGLGLIRALIRFAGICRDAGTRTEAALGALDEAIEMARAPRYQSVRDRLILTARAIGADLLAAAGRHQEADAMRRTAQQSPQPDQPTPGDLAQVARSIGKLHPQIARARLENHFRSKEIAALILAMRPQGYWLHVVLDGFERTRRAAVVKWLVQDVALLDDPVVTRYVVQLLRGHDTLSIARFLGWAAPVVAAVVLENVSSYTACQVMPFVEPARIAAIIRELGYDPRVEILREDG
ncbi:ATP-binding protein [Actinoplanes subtropicus]|uniref:ATP-binding protein n=1 Tax=Actinoplanes subtropicus TaxID=543632 RepID=UPI0012FBE59E|nr:ATP-binding protein [Actinoplanes subtropicus]